MNYSKVLFHEIYSKGRIDFSPRIFQRTNWILNSLSRERTIFFSHATAGHATVTAAEERIGVLQKKALCLAVRVMRTMYLYRTQVCVFVKYGLQCLFLVTLSIYLDVGKNKHMHVYISIHVWGMGSGMKQNVKDVNILHTQLSTCKIDRPFSSSRFL